ncbi:glutathione S-transferase family protein [Erwinia persicina]|uniref:glutathione S-transferase family protein n=1 Tax=Erwinia persicina TaxID=55211 RepID=UPI001F0794C7|nr:glutathione S-transferase [Erwinia persicina]
MVLIGMLDSPYVRRVAVCMNVLGLQYEHRPLSVFGDFEAFAKINPAVKAPTLITDDQQILMESSLIIRYLQDLSPHTSALVPESAEDRVRDVSLTGLALAACEKAVQIVYERRLRPEEKQHQPWVDRVTRQLHGVWQALEEQVQAHPPAILTVGGSVSPWRGVLPA